MGRTQSDCRASGLRRTLLLFFVLAGMFAPAPAVAQDHEFNTRTSAGSFGLSLSDATFRAAGMGTGTFVGRYMYEMELTLAPSPVSPLAREVSGNLICTDMGGSQLYITVAGTIQYDPNARTIVNGSLTRCEVVGGTRRFATATGSGTFSLLANVDDSGVDGDLAFGVAVTMTLR